MRVFCSAFIFVFILVIVPGLAGCKKTNDPEPGVSQTVVPGDIREPATDIAGTSKTTENDGVNTGFSWVILEKLAGMPRPGASSSLRTDFGFLKDQKISLIVSLTEEPLPPEELEASGFSSLHLPVADMTAPTIPQLDEFVSVVKRTIASGQRAAVHCAAGKGRTGTFLAAYFIHQGMTSSQAIDHIRALRPGSIETEDQVAVLELFADLQQHKRQSD